MHQSQVLFHATLSYLFWFERVFSALIGSLLVVACSILLHCILLIASFCLPRSNEQAAARLLLSAASFAATRFRNRLCKRQESETKRAAAWMRTLG